MLQSAVDLRLSERFETMIHHVQLLPGTKLGREVWTDQYFAHHARDTGIDDPFWLWVIRNNTEQLPLRMHMCSSWANSYVNSLEFIDIMKSTQKSAAKDR